MPFDGTQVSEKAQILIKALELLRRDGWFQVGPDPGTAQRCAIIAIYDAEAKSRSHHWAVYHEYLNLHKDGYFSMTGWNDSPGRTFAEVEAFFEQEIAKALGLGNGSS